jgi:glucosamine--fructose-6-phosphate aminotransferase (isomerizing)
MTTMDGSGTDLGALLTWREASTAGDAIAAALGADPEAASGAGRILAAAQDVVVTGAGSSYYLAQVAAAVGRAVIGRPVLAVPVSEVLLRPDGVFTARTPSTEPVVVISRSGSTSEAVAAVEAASSAGHPTIGVTCRAESPMARRADVTLVSPGGDERAIVMTRSFASMLALLLRVVADVGGDRRLVEDLDRSPRCWPEVVAAVERGDALGRRDWSRVVVLGGGPRSGLAAEWGLKLLETSQVPTSAYEPLEFRHGPMSLCEPGVLVVGLLGGPGAADEVRVLREASRLGATTWILAGERDAVGPTEDWRDGAVDIIGPELVPPARLPLMVTPGHALALRLALTRGRDPDAPRHLDQVVILEP